MQPGGACELTIPQMANVTAPRFDAPGAYLPQLGLLVTGMRATLGALLHRRNGRHPGAAEHQQAQPVQTRHTDWATARWIEEAWANTFEPARRARAYGTEVSIRDPFGLFQQAAIPHQQDFLAWFTEPSERGYPPAARASQPSDGRSSVVSAADCSRAWRPRAPAQA